MDDDDDGDDDDDDDDDVLDDDEEEEDDGEEEDFLKAKATKSAEISDSVGLSYLAWKCFNGSLMSAVSVMMNE